MLGGRRRAALARGPPRRAGGIGCGGPAAQGKEKKRRRLCEETAEEEPLEDDPVVELTPLQASTVPPGELDWAQQLRTLRSRILIIMSFTGAQFFRNPEVMITAVTARSIRFLGSTLLPSLLSGSLIKLSSRKEGTVIVKGLLRNRD